MCLCPSKVKYETNVHLLLRVIISYTNFPFIKDEMFVLSLPVRALEQLRSSMYNELRTSEGAKRQQLRFCGPCMAMTFNFVVAVSIILANKVVCSQLHC